MKGDFSLYQYIIHISYYNQLVLLLLDQFLYDHLMDVLHLECLHYINHIIQDLIDLLLVLRLVIKQLFYDELELTHYDVLTVLELPIIYRYSCRVAHRYSWNTRIAIDEGIASTKEGLQVETMHTDGEEGSLECLIEMDMVDMGSQFIQEGNDVLYTLRVLDVSIHDMQSPLLQQSIE